MVKELTRAGHSDIKFDEFDIITEMKFFNDGKNLRV